MCSSLLGPGKPAPSLCIAFIAILALLVSGWTCTTLVAFKSCQGVVPQAQITALSPATIPRDVTLILLTVDGSGFTPQSQITWNGSTLQTTFMDSAHLQTTITQETFNFFGGSAGSTVLISVQSQGSALGCPPVGNFATLSLVII